MKLAFYQFVTGTAKTELSIQPDDIMIGTVLVEREDWSFGNGDP